MFVSLLIGLFLAGQFSCSPRESQTSKPVAFKALRAVDHLTDPGQVAVWMRPFSQWPADSLQWLPNGIIHGQDTLLIIQQTAVDVIYLRRSPGLTGAFSLTAAPLVETPNSTQFIQQFRVQGQPAWPSDKTWTTDATASLDSLVAYFSSPQKMYGYPVREILVTDTAFLFASREIASADFTRESTALFDMLLRQARALNVPYTGVRIFNIDKEGPRRTIYAGIGIERRVDTAPGDSASFKWMPYQKNLLAIDFEGPYAEIDQLKEALERYRLDHQKSSMAIPFHKYLSDGYGFADSQVVKLRACLPVY